MELGKISEQYQLEKQSRLEGEYRVNWRSSQLISKGHGSQTTQGKSFVGILIDVVSNQLEIDLLEYTFKGRGRPGHHFLATKN